MCNGEYTYVNTLLCTDVRKKICEIYDELIQQINGKKSGKVTSWKIRELGSGPDIATFHSFSEQSTPSLLPNNGVKGDSTLVIYDQLRPSGRILEHIRSVLGGSKTTTGRETAH